MQEETRTLRFRHLPEEMEAYKGKRDISGGHLHNPTNPDVCAHHPETSPRQGISVTDSAGNGSGWFDQSNSSSDEDRSRWHYFADFS